MFENEGLKTTFAVRVPPTVRDALKYYEHVEDTGNGDTYGRLWAGLCAIVRDWESEYIKKPDPFIMDEITLDDEKGNEVFNVIKWASLELFSYMHHLRKTPKN